MKKVEIGQAISFGWQQLIKNFWYFIGLSIIYSLLTSFTNYLWRNVEFDFLGLIIGAWLMPGIYKIVLVRYNGKTLPFETIFTQIQYFWRYLGAQILVTLIVIGGFILLIVPGIYWALKYMFVPILIVDKDIAISEAFGKSGEITKGIKLRLFLLCLALLGITVLGILLFGVGVFVAIPIVWLATIYIYKKLT